jgi:hypothetical protein
MAPNSSRRKPVTTLFVRHQVADYARWKQVYDDFKPTQKKLGVTAETVYRAADNPNDVTVAHEFLALDAARKFAASDDLHTAMNQAGIVGEPSIWFASRA